MKRLLIATTARTLLIAPLGAAFAQGHDDRHDDRRVEELTIPPVA